jgi:hypothetical protein
MKLCEIPKRFTIKVTAADIKKGKRNSVCSCPIALAVRRQLRAKRGEIAVTGSVSLQPKKLPWWAENSIEYGLTDRASDFIENFDAGRPVKPFTFVARGNV